MILFMFISKKFLTNKKSGGKKCLSVKILIPETPKKTDSYRKKKKQHKFFCRRAATEPTISLLKFNHRMSRNFLKGVTGDVMNLLLAAAAFNFKRAMNALL